MKSYFKQIEIETKQNNILDLQDNLGEHVDERADFFSLYDLTDDCYEWVKQSGLKNGLLTVQVLHTTCVICINELNEPCLVADINKLLRENFPRNRAYLHNSPLRTENLCDDLTCDQNGDAHAKSSLNGVPTQTVIVRDGKPLFGTWQRLCMIEFDGPRTRKVAIQILGTDE